jgi:sulfur relay (sulfurtransferase) DsrC/TusE family protein
MDRKPTHPDLSAQERNVLRAIVEFYAEFNAPPNGPQVAERAFGDSEKRVLAWYHIRNLREKGLLRSDPEVRGLPVPVSMEEARQLVL